LKVNITESGIGLRFLIRNMTLT